MLIATMTYHTTHQEGRSALSLAAERGDVDVMKVLIEGGADVNTQNKVIMYRNLHYTGHMHTVNMCLYECNVPIYIYEHINLIEELRNIELL